jgi:hypothetical protein
LKGEKVWNINLQKKQQKIKDVVFKRYNGNLFWFLYTIACTLAMED